MNKIVVTNLNKKNTFSEEGIKKIARRVLELLKKKNCYLEFFLISNRKMKFLNKKFRGPAQKQASDILTFVEPGNFPHPESKLKFLGEIYLNIDCINKKDFAPLIAHGLLHLLGFQHKKKSDRIKMEVKEKFLISNF